MNFFGFCHTWKFEFFDFVKTELHVQVRAVSSIKKFLKYSILLKFFRYILQNSRNDTILFVLQDLGSRDLSREKVYLVCYVIKNSSIDSYQNSKNVAKNGNLDSFNSVRKAYAIACFNLSPYFNGSVETDEDKHHFLPLLPYVINFFIFDINIVFGTWKLASHFCHRRAKYFFQNFPRIF